MSMESIPLIEMGPFTVQECKRGLFAFCRNDEVVGRSLSHYGQWCDEEFDLLDEVIELGDVVVDVGAYIGTHTVFFGKKVGSWGRVIAFEPQQLSYQLLQTNLTLNALTNVRAFHMALSDKEASFIHKPHDGYEWINFGASRLDEYKIGEEVKIKTLDSFELKRCNLIKIDVEEMEVFVLRGARETIRRTRPLLYLENNTTHRSKELLMELEELGYDSFWHQVPYFNLNNFRKAQENIFQGGIRPFEVNMICFPKEKAVVPKGLLKVNSVEDNWHRLAHELGDFAKKLSP